MNVLKKFFRKQNFMDVTGYNCGVSLAGPPIMTAWCFVADGVLIDTGIRHLRDRILSALSEDRPDTVLVTHHHEDHSGNAGPLKDKLGLPVFGHPLTALKLRTPFKIKPYQHLVWGKSDPVLVTPFPDLIETRRLRFRPIHTPGHSEDHTVYLEETRGMLFSGDLFLGERIKFFRADECFEDQLASLRRVLEFDFEHLFCAHRPTMDKGKEALARKLDFLLDFYEKVKDLRQKGWSTRAIIRRLDRKNDRTVKWITLNNACFSHMAKSAIRLADMEIGKS